MAKKNTVPAKKVTVKIDKDPHKSYFVGKHGIKIYPVSEFEFKGRQGINAFNLIKSNNWFVEVDNNGSRKVFTKMVKTTEVNDSVWATINHYYKLLTEESKTNTKTK